MLIGYSFRNVFGTVTQNAAEYNTVELATMPAPSNITMLSCGDYYGVDAVDVDTDAGAVGVGYVYKSQRCYDTSSKHAD